jgi:hypothetical protein
LVIIINEFAAEELKEAVDFYELQVEGLGKIFKDEIKFALRSIKKNPETWPVESGDIKKFILHKFPYKILYSIETDYIYVIAIAHMHRRPQYWTKR